MNQMSLFNFAGAVTIIVIILISNCVVCHEESANVNRRMSRLTDDGSTTVQLQQHQHYHHHAEPNTDQRNVNTVKDQQRYTNNDKIIFDRGDLYSMINNIRTTTVSSMTIGNNLPKSNETNHQYSGKANGEYEFR